MSNVDKVNAKKFQAFQSKVNFKLNALQSFIEGDTGVFTVPARFTYNWLSSLSEGDFESFSKMTAAVRSGTPLRDKIDRLLTKAEKKRLLLTVDNSTGNKTTKELQRKYDKLKFEHKNLKEAYLVKSDEVIALMSKVAQLENKLGATQAQWDDLKRSTGSVVKGKF